MEFIREGLSFEEAILLDIGKKVTGTIAQPGMEHYFVIAPQETRKYDILLESDQDSVIGIFTQDNQVTPFAREDAGTRKLRVLLDAEKNYYIKVRFNNNQIGNYSLTISSFIDPVNTSYVIPKKDCFGVVKVPIEGDIPTNKVVAVSLSTPSRLVLTNYIDYIGFGNLSGEIDFSSGKTSPYSLTAFYKVTDLGAYRANISFKEKSVSAVPEDITVHFYTIDYTTGTEKFIHCDANEIPQGNGDELFPENEKYPKHGTKNYLVDCHPELLSRYDAQHNQMQLGENGYYLQKSKINGTANIYWEHVNLDEAYKLYGILLYNSSNEPINVSLLKRSHYMNSDYDRDKRYKCFIDVWEDYFNNNPMVDDEHSDFHNSAPVQIPAKESRWLSLYRVPYLLNSDGEYDYRNQFNGVIKVDIKNQAGQPYTGEELFCYTFWMEDNWDNASYVKANAMGANFTRAYNDNWDTYNSICGSGNGAFLCSTVDRVIDLRQDRFSLVMAGIEPREFNEGEKILCWHDGPNCVGWTNPGDEHPLGYEVLSMNYGVIYKIEFKQGFKSNSGVKATVKMNELVNTNVVESPFNGIYVGMFCNPLESDSSNTNDPFYFSGDLIAADKNYTYEFNYTPAGGVQTNYIADNKPITFYIVTSGMSSMPTEISFESIA